MKKTNVGKALKRPLLEFDLKMKLSVLLLFTSFFSMLANSGYSQAITIDVENTTVRRVIDKIETSSEYSFVYNTRFVDLDRKVSISADKASIEAVLGMMFDGTKTSYELNSTQIILKEKKFVPIKPESKVPEMEFQEYTVSGTITDDTGQPMPGANVVEKNTTNGTQADFDGNFTLTLENENAILVISYLGFITKEIEVNGDSTINVVLEVGTSTLEEVVLVGYGSVAKKDLTGSVTTVSSDGFDVIAGSSPLTAMQGRSAGVQILNNSGLPGSGASVTVRGPASVTGSGSPIYVVDGVISNNIDFLNQNNIKAISILKDASAAAIYGARAANGVVLVTTKRGRKNSAPEINLNSYVGLANESNLKHKLLNGQQYLDLWTEAYENSNTPLDWDVDNIPLLQEVDTNWKDLMLRTGIIKSYDLSVSGGSERSNYFISANIINQEGIVIETGQDKYTFRINSDHKINDWLKFGNSLTLNSNTIFGDESNYRLALTKAPVTKHLEDDGSWGQIVDVGIEHNFVNPVWKAQNSENTRKWKGLQGSLYLTLSPLQGLELTARSSLNYSNLLATEFTPGVPSGYNWGASFINTVLKETQENVYWLNEFLMNYKFSLDDSHDFKFLMGYSREENTSENIGAQRTGTPNNEIRYLDAGDPVSQTNSNSFTDWAFESMFGRLDYSFKDRYLMSFTLRRDGTSRLTEENRFGVFPSASIAWRISEEPFLNDSEVITDLKLRASYGELGNVNVIGPYGTVSSLTAQRAVINDAPALGYTLTSAINTDVTWESAKKKNFGVDATFFNGALYTSLDYFVDDTFDMLFSEPIPNSTGLSGSPVINGGNVRNTGLEGVLGVRGGNTDWNFNVSVNFSTIKNEVIDLEGREFITFGSDRLSYQHKLGNPVRSFFGYKSNGLIRDASELAMYQAAGSSFPTKEVGDIALLDIDGYDTNGELTGTPDGIINSADRTIIGDNFPKLIYGALATVGYKNLGLQVQLSGVQGIDEYFGPGQSTDTFQMMTSLAQNEDARILNRFHPINNPDGTYPKLNRNASGQNVVFSDFWLEDASYLRIQNISLSYDFSEAVLTKLNGLNKLGLYMSVQNAYTFTKNESPEVGYATQSGGGIQNYVTGVPNPRIISLGVKVGF